MPLSQTNQLLIILILALLATLGYYNYASNPLMTTEGLLQRPGDFRNLLLLEPRVFIEQIVSHILPHNGLPRNYLIRDDYAALGLWTRNTSVTMLSILFDQCPSTTYSDIHHYAILFVDILASYYDLIGTGAFRHFPRSLLAVDIIKVCIYNMRRPHDVNHAQYFDGFMLGIDSTDLCDEYNGHLPGSQNDGIFAVNGLYDRFIVPIVGLNGIVV